MSHVSLPIPDHVKDIARTLEHAGYDTWCVGGAVRDNLLGVVNTDYDLATSAAPDAMQRLFRRTVPVGIEHGTVGVLDQDGVMHEVTTFRKDVRTDGRHAVVEFGASLDDDLARRDFTINAMAYHPFREELRDPFGGRRDIDARCIRAVGDPARRFQEDYLRILRAFRFAARFDFTIDPTTRTAARGHVDGLDSLSAERVREEWFKGVVTARSLDVFVRLWAESGAMERWLPECVVGYAGELTRGSYDVLREWTVRDPVLALAYLSRDPARSLVRFKASNTDIRRGELIGKFRKRRPNTSSVREVRRWMANVGDAADDLAAILGLEHDDPSLQAAIADVRASGAPLSVGDLAVDGHGLIEAGVPPGPDVGRVLRDLLAMVIDSPELNTPEHLLAEVRRQHPKGQS